MTTYSEQIPSTDGRKAIAFGTVLWNKPNGMMLLVCYSTDSTEIYPSIGISKYTHSNHFDFKHIILSSEFPDFTYNSGGTIQYWNTLSLSKAYKLEVIY